MSATEQLQYESGVRFRYAVIAFVAALLIVASQLLQLAGVHSPVTELTLDLIAFSQRSSLDIVGAVLDMVGLIGLGALLYWLHGVARARRPELKGFVKWIATVGAGLTAIVAVVETIVVSGKAHTFVTTGNQGYPEANHLTSSGAIVAMPLLLEFGTLLLAIGIILTSLSAMRVGLVTRLVGYAGVIAGALFMFPIQGIAPLIQGFWLASIAVILAARWPSGELPAWESGESVPWQPMQNPPQERGTRAQRRRKVSDSEVLAAVETDAPPVPKNAGRSKRKRRR
jgi:hypothetical protein